VSAVEPGVLPASWPASADCAGVPPFHTHPYVDYPEGTTYQPDEHVLELGRAHLLELQDALDRMPGPVVRRALSDFTVWPVAPPA
jgi:hypothetical protein